MRVRVKKLAVRATFSECGGVSAAGRVRETARCLACAAGQIAETVGCPMERMLAEIFLAALEQAGGYKMEERK